MPSWLPDAIVTLWCRAAVPPVVHRFAAHAQPHGERGEQHQEDQCQEAGQDEEGPPRRTQEAGRGCGIVRCGVLCLDIGVFILWARLEPPSSCACVRAELTAVVVLK